MQQNLLFLINKIKDTKKNSQWQKTLISSVTTQVFLVLLKNPLFKVSRKIYLYDQHFFQFLKFVFTYDVECFVVSIYSGLA